MGFGTENLLHRIRSRQAWNSAQDTVTSRYHFDKQNNTTLNMLTFEYKLTFCILKHLKNFKLSLGIYSFRLGYGYLGFLVFNKASVIVLIAYP